MAEQLRTIGWRPRPDQLVWTKERDEAWEQAHYDEFVRPVHLLGHFWCDACCTSFDSANALRDHLVSRMMTPEVIDMSVDTQQAQIDSLRTTNA